MFFEDKTKLVRSVSFLAIPATASLFVLLFSTIIFLQVLATQDSHNNSKSERFSEPQSSFINK
jgi:preprotein translocase subunit SecG